jgi:hypothetical protein
MPLLDDINAFIEAHKITERQFGELSVNDKNLVPQLKGEKGPRPRRLWPETEARIRRFMATYRPDAQQDAAA